jgi:hypothetical protein
MAYLSIINKNHSTLEEIREAELAHREEVRSARAKHCADICQAIADILQEDYLAWVDAQPVHGFYDAACDMLLDLHRPVIDLDGTEASPYIVGGEIFSPSFVSAHDVMPF